MAERDAGWLVAAACREVPQSRVTFADLPRQHKREFVRFALVAAASTASFIALWALSQPIRGRNLRSEVTLPHGAAAPSPLLEARLTAPIEPPSPAPFRARATRPRASVQLASLRESSAPTERKRNIFSRFFRGVWRGLS